MRARSSLPPLLVVFYANPDQYPPTYNAVSLLRSRFDVRVVSRSSEVVSRAWPDDVALERVGRGGSARELAAQSAARKLADFAGFVRAVRRAYRETRPRVVYAYEPYALVAVALAGIRAPVVYQRHEVEDADRLASTSRRSLLGWVLRGSLALSRRARLVVFPERDRAAYYQRLVPGLPDPIIVPNFPLRETFADPTRDAASFEALLDARFERRQIFYRGSIGPSNGMREAVRALALVARKDPRATLKLCGSAEPAFLDELAKLADAEGVRSRVDFAGFVPSFDRLNRETLEASTGLLLYQPIDVNWTCSATATNKLYEYAACALPALAPDRRSYRDLLADEPWAALVDETDPASIAAAIERILADRSRYGDLCRAARRAFDERFNYESVFAPLLDRITAIAEAG